MSPTPRRHHQYPRRTSAAGRCLAAVLLLWCCCCCSRIRVDAHPPFGTRKAGRPRSCSARRVEQPVEDEPAHCPWRFPPRRRRVVSVQAASGERPGTKPWMDWVLRRRSGGSAAGGQADDDDVVVRTVTTRIQADDPPDVNAATNTRTTHYDDNRAATSPTAAANASRTTTTTTRTTSRAKKEAEAPQQRNSSLSFRFLTVEDGLNDDRYGTLGVIHARTQQQRPPEAALETTTTTVWNGAAPIRSLAVWHCLALLSDQLVVILDSDNMRNDAAFWHAVLAGLRQRQRAGLTRGRLRIVMDDSSTSTNDLDRWRQEMVLQTLSEFTPALLENLEIVGFEDYRQSVIVLLQDVIIEISPESRRRTDSLVDRASLAAVVRQAYRELGGRLLFPLESSSSSDDGYDQESDTTIALVEPIENDDETEDSAAATTTTGSSGGPKGADSFGTAHQKTLSEMDQVALQSIYQQLDELQTLLEDNLLNDDAASLPIDFASHAAPILEALAALQPVQHLPKGVYDFIQARLRELHQQHMERLRDHFGKMYETLLEREPPKSWDAVRARTLVSFREMASGSVPQQAREGGIFRDLDFDCVGTLAGLGSDLKEITDLRRVLVVDDDDELQIETVSSRRRKRIVKWCKRLAARGLMFGINYLQGWLAWQGIRNQALERERRLPKFPLF